MTEETWFKTPVGRVIQGNVQKGNSHNRDGEAYVVKNGARAGQPYQNFFFALAIPKAGETHWKETEWGAHIFATAHAAWPQKQPDRPDFAWKVDDGDSLTPNKEGRVNAQTDGFPGHWVLRFSTNYAPQVVNADGTQTILEEDAIKRGYFVQVYAGVKGNGNAKNPGVYMSAKIVALSAYGEEIKSAGIDASTLGFGGAPLPAGAASTPAAAFTPPAAVVAPPVAAPVAPPAPPVAPPPNPAILQPPVHKMTALAQGATRAQLHGAGWTDETLIANGLMEA